MSKRDAMEDGRMSCQKRRTVQVCQSLAGIGLMEVEVKHRARVAQYVTNAQWSADKGMLNLERGPVFICLFEKS